MFLLKKFVQSKLFILSQTQDGPVARFDVVVIRLTVRWRCTAVWRKTAWIKGRLRKNSAMEGFQCIGHSSWAICILLKPFCSGDLPSFSLSYWEANSYYPTGIIMGKGNSPNFKIGWYSGFSVPGPFNLAHLHHFKPFLLWKFSNFFTFILGSQL